jgi:hypothetical protein
MIIFLLKYYILNIVTKAETELAILKLSIKRWFPWQQ